MITEEMTINKGRLFVVGDLHGMFNLLEERLELVGFNKEIDTIVSVGDLVDRGDQSERFYEFLKKTYFKAVLGNHEEMMIKASLYPTEENISFWRYNGGEWSLNTVISKEMLDTVSNLPIALTINFKGFKIGVVHAGVPYEINDWNLLIEKLEDGSSIQKFNCLWDRARAKYALIGTADKIENVDLVVGGHTIQSTIFIDKNSLFIDTGAYFLSENYSDREDSDLFSLTVIELLVIDNQLDFVRR